MGLGEDSGKNAVKEAEQKRKRLKWLIAYTVNCLFAILGLTAFEVSQKHKSSYQWHGAVHDRGQEGSQAPLR